MPLPRLKLREFSDEQVRTRSPRPGEAGERLGPRALGEAEAGHLGEAARDQGGAGVEAEPAPLDHAAGDGEHVLDRAADLGARHVARLVGAEMRPGEAGGQPFGQGRILARQRHRRRQPRRHFMREGGAGEDGERRLRPRLVRDLVHQQAGAGLDALGAEHQRRVRRRQAAENGAQMLGRRDDEQGVAIGQLGEIGGGADRWPTARTPARNSRFSWAALIESTTSGSRAQSSTSSPPAAATWASAVPQAPPPMTPILMPSPPRRARARRRDRAASGRGPARRADR